MYKILINAYACSPNMGSEPGMAWNWCANLAKHCELHIITEGEFRDKIDSVISTLPQGKNMNFYYNPIGGGNIAKCERIRMMCWNQGDWRFYFYYKKWQKKTADIARVICEKEKINILHQLNMIGFREPGYLWKVSQETEIPFVWGPIGGLKQFPILYTENAPLKIKLHVRLKNFLNLWQLKYNRRVNMAFRQASVLISAIPDSYKAIKKYKRRESVIIPETGTFPQDEKLSLKDRFRRSELNIIWAGKFDYRKRLDIALAVLASVNNRRIKLKIFGTGNKQQQTETLNLIKTLGLENQVQWMGDCPNKQVKEAMQSADIFLFTSVNEDTSTVVLEAISHQLPVLCFDTCGMSNVVTENVGIKIPLTNSTQSVKDFADKIIYLDSHREVLEQMSMSCRQRIKELSWENKALQMVNLYKKVLLNNVETS